MSYYSSSGKKKKKKKKKKRRNSFLQNSIMHELMEPDGTLQPILEESPSMEEKEGSSGGNLQQQQSSGGFNIRNHLADVKMTSNHSIKQEEKVQFEEEKKLFEYEKKQTEIITPQIPRYEQLLNMTEPEPFQHKEHI